MAGMQRRMRLSNKLKSFSLPGKRQNTLDVALNIEKINDFPQAGEEGGGGERAGVGALACKARWLGKLVGLLGR